MAVPRPATTSPLRRATNMPLPVDLLAEARRLGLNLSQICGRGLRAEIAKAQADQWREDNREALISSNQFVERHGLPLAEFRSF
jgi:antitoxin CcdA